MPRVSVAERLSHLRALLRRGAVSFDEAVRGADRITVAVTLFALLELYKQGEATWTQEEAFGDIAIAPLAAARPSPPPRGGGVTALGPLARTLEALLFLSPEPVAVVDLAQAADCWPDDAEAALEELREAYAPGARGLVLRELAGGFTLATAPEAEPAARRLLAQAAHPAADAGPGRDARDRRLPAARLAPRDHADPRRQRRLGLGDAARARPDRGGRPLAVRRRALPDDPAVPEALRPESLEDLPDPSAWDPTADEEAELRDRLLKAGEQRAGAAPVGPDGAPAPPAG